MSGFNYGAVDLDEVSEADQNDIAKILKDTDELDRNLFNTINSGKNFSVQSSSEKNSKKSRNLNFDESFDELDNFNPKKVVSSVEPKQSIVGKSINKSVSQSIPNRSITKKDFNDLFGDNQALKLSSLRNQNELFESVNENNASSTKRVDDEDILSRSVDEDFKFGGYLPSSAAALSSSNKKSTKSLKKIDFMFDDEEQDRPKTASAVSAQQQTKTAKSQDNNFMKTYPIKNSAQESNGLDFNFEFENLLKAKSDVKKTPRNSTSKNEWLINNEDYKLEPPKNQTFVDSNENSFENGVEFEKPIKISTQGKSLPKDEFNNEKKSQTDENVENHVTNDKINELKKKIKELESEIAELNMKLGQQKSQYESQIEMLTESCEQRVKLMRDDREMLIKHHNEAKQALQAHIDDLEKQQTETYSDYKAKLRSREKEFDNEMEKSRHASKVAVEKLKLEYEERFEQIKRTKDEEIQDILRSRTTNNNSGFVTYDAQKSKENIKAKENQEYENQIRMLNETIQRLEFHLGEQTRSNDSERLRMKQQEKKLEAFQDSLIVEHRELTEKLLRERNDVEKAKAEMLAEQKRLMDQIYEEKRKITEEKVKLDASIIGYKEKLYKDSLSKMNMEAEISVNSKRLKEEQAHLERLKLEIKEKEALLNQEQMKLEQKKQELEMNLKKLEQSELSVNQKLSKGNELYMESLKEKNEQMRILDQANSMKQSYEIVLNQINNKMIILNQKEEEINQKNLSIYKQHQELEKLKSTIMCTNCKGPVKNLSFLDLTTTLKTMTQHNNTRSLVNQIQKVELEDSKLLRQLKVEAYKDKIFVNEEKQFIDTIQRV